jgi:hypothetical protein
MQQARRRPTLCGVLCVLVVAAAALTFVAADNLGPPDTRLSSSGALSTETPVEYGVDVSFPIHHATVSENYVWLPHNMDHAKYPVTPAKYEHQVTQPLSNRQKFYDDFIKGAYTSTLYRV